jgi:hypothetical protein
VNSGYKKTVNFFTAVRLGMIFPFIKNDEITLRLSRETKTGTPDNRVTGRLAADIPMQFGFLRELFDKERQPNYTHTLSAGRESAANVFLLAENLTKTGSRIIRVEPRALSASNPRTV